MLCSVRIYRTHSSPCSRAHLPAVLYRTHAPCFLATLQSHEHLRHQVEILIRLAIGVDALLTVYCQICVWFLTLQYCIVVASSRQHCVSYTHLLIRILLLVYECRVSTVNSVLCKSVLQIILLLLRQLRNLKDRYFEFRQI
jgi:hypothetical protein